MVTSEQQLAGILSAIAEGLIVQDADGRIEICNESAQRILGVTAGRISGIVFTDFEAIREDGSPFPAAAHPAAVTFNTGQSVSGVVMGIHRPDGELRWISVSSRLVSGDPASQVVVTTFADITGQKAAAQTFQLHQERWKVALEASRDGVWDWNIETNETFVSARWKEMIGFRENEIGETRSDWADRIHPDDRDRVLAAAQAHMEGKTPFYEAEYRLKCKDGSWKWILGRGAVVRRDSGGRPLRLTGTHTDLTERKTAECAERRYREIFEGALEGIYRSSLDGKILAANPAAARTGRFRGRSCRGHH